MDLGFEDLVSFFGIFASIVSHMACGISAVGDLSTLMLFGQVDRMMWALTD